MFVDSKHPDWLETAFLAVDERSIQKIFLHENIYCGYSLEAPRWGASNEYPLHMFS